MNTPIICADMTVRKSGNGLCIQVTDACRLLGAEAGDRVRVTIETFAEESE